jgi:phospholipase C
MERREFLKRAGLVAGAAGAATLGGSLLSACSGSSSSSSLSFDSILDHAPSDSNIDTVVIVMMENRSFDHYLGWLADDEEYLDAGKRRYGKKFAVMGKNQMHYPDPKGVEIPTAHLTQSTEFPVPFRGCDHPVPGHGWLTGRAQRNQGFLGSLTGNDEFAVGYYEGEDLPFYTDFTRRFTTCDRWHSSLLAGTFPNRQYLHSATSEGRKEDPIPLEVDIYKAETFWDRLRKEHVSSRYYYTDLPLLTLWGPRLFDIISPVDDYFTDAAAGKLPHVVMVEPSFRGEDRGDDHPQGDIRIGQRFIREVFKAFAESPQWEHGMFVLAYDEWGGFFDHRPPATFADQRSSPIDILDFGQGGFRVPAMVASPYVAPGAVNHTLYDHTSIMRFLEWRFMGAPAHGPNGHGRKWWLTERDRNAQNIGQVVGLETADPEVGFDLKGALEFEQAVCSHALGSDAIGGPGDTPLSDRLQTLIQTVFKEAKTKPWILPLAGTTPPSSG